MSRRSRRSRLIALREKGEGGGMLDGRMGVVLEEGIWGVGRRVGMLRT